MEKFGIFELLDALSALTAGTQASPPAEADPPHPGENAGEEKPAFDHAFDPPAYGGTGAAPEHGGSALDSFLARHEETKGKAKK